MPLPRIAAIAALAAAATGASATSLATLASELDASASAADAALSEQRLRGLLAQQPAGEPQALLIDVEIARGQRVQGLFAAAHATLDRVGAALDGMPSLVRIRYLLERGRLHAAEGANERAAPLLVEARSLAACAGETRAAAEATRLLGQTATDPDAPLQESPASLLR